MTLLFITQKLHEQDAFGVLWVRAFERIGYKVTVLCLEKRLAGEPRLRVFSMGKEKGASRLLQVLRFWRHILMRRYDRVFIHMSPVWGLLGAPIFIMRRTPTYLWYTHYKRSVAVRVTEFYAKRIFCATEQSVPWLKGAKKSKKVVTGHGIDLGYWRERPTICTNPRALLMVHRLSRSKRVELSLQALALLPALYILDVYGIEAEPDYVQELCALVRKLNLGARVTFHGTVPMEVLREMYPRHRFILNMASETIDKTMLEAMTCGCYPVVTKRNAKSIGIPLAPEADTPNSISTFIQKYTDGPLPLSGASMYRIVSERHSLEGLTAKMDQYIRPGT